MHKTWPIPITLVRIVLSKGSQCRPICRDNMYQI